MNRSDALQLLYPKAKTASEFNFDNLFHPPILCYLSLQDIAHLNNIATSIKLSTKPNEKYRLINNIMMNRGFVKMASGTNRVVYRFADDYSFVLKIAIDKVGCRDNPMEMVNQHLLKPFVTKCFDVTPCGTVGMFERVVPITYREEFLSIADDVFNLINNLIGKYVIDDIGEKYYQNYGIRNCFGPVLLDYPYVYELDGAKLRCNTVDPITNLACLGEIDYDIGYNDLVCKKCGKRYIATDLKTVKNEDAKIIVEGKDDKMKISLMRGNKVVSRLGNTRRAVDTIKNGIKSGRLNNITLVTENCLDKDNTNLPVIKTGDRNLAGFHQNFVKVEKDSEQPPVRANLGDVIAQYTQAKLPIPESIKEQIRGTELEALLHEKVQKDEQETPKEETVETSVSLTPSFEENEKLEDPEEVDDSAQLEAAVDLSNGLIIECTNGTVIATLIPSQLERFRKATSTAKPDSNSKKNNHEVKNEKNDNSEDKGSVSKDENAVETTETESLSHSSRKELPMDDSDSELHDQEEEEIERVEAEEILPAEEERDLNLHERTVYDDSIDPIESTAIEVDVSEKPTGKNIPQSSIEESAKGERDVSRMSSSFNVETVVGKKIREAYYSAPVEGGGSITSKLIIHGRDESQITEEEKMQIVENY